MKKVVVSKDILKNNLEVIKEKLYNENKDAKLIVVVKDNGVGIDIVQLSKFLDENSVDILAVAVTDEALAIKENGIKTEVLMLSPVVEEDELEDLIKNDVTLTVGSLYEIDLIKKILDKLGKEKVNVHVKVDTGFARFGFLYTNPNEIIKVYKDYDFLNIKGIYTHYSSATDEKWTNKQFNRFCDITNKIKEAGFETGIRHCAATTTFLKYPNMTLDAIRIGSIIQGRSVIPWDKLKKTGMFTTKVVEVKTLPKGFNVSYGNSYTTTKETKVATIPVGYMDGFNRTKDRDDYSFKNNIISVLREIKKIFTDNSLKVMINGKEYKVLGRLGMYHAIIDITGTDDIVEGTIVEIPTIKPFLTNDKIRREYI